MPIERQIGHQVNGLPATKLLNLFLESIGEGKFSGETPFTQPPRRELIAPFEWGLRIRKPSLYVYVSLPSL